jgi:hypothetical protein
VTATKIRQRGAVWRGRPDWLLSGRDTTSLAATKRQSIVFPLAMPLSFCLFPLMRQIRAYRYFWPTPSPGSPLAIRSIASIGDSKPRGG